ncbi:T9SS type A sorting domain-containing protein, partial [candidate division KSB1 bacterium]|nr:T9SS type A sorting domain-containing protein [candidate division KSB1 bacterium]
YIILKPGMWLNEGSYGGFEVLIDNIAVYPESKSGLTGVAARDMPVTATDYILEQNYPNPFNPSTQIAFSLSKKEAITLEIFDILGKKVATLLTNESKNPGRHLVNFDAVDLSTGVYFYKMQAGNMVEMKKMILVK